SCYPTARSVFAKPRPRDEDSTRFPQAAGDARASYWTCSRILGIPVHSSHWGHFDPPGEQHPGSPSQQAPPQSGSDHNGRQPKKDTGQIEEERSHRGGIVPNALNTSARGQLQLIDWPPLKSKDLGIRLCAQRNRKCNSFDLLRQGCEFGL